MALYSLNNLKQLATASATTIRTKMMSESQSTHSSFDIFIAHSFLDKDAVNGLYVDLTRRGFKVYVDWIVDPQLDRNNVSKETAVIIRNRLEASKSLLLAVSTSASLSKWIPWELGVVDGHTKKCAIVPVTDNLIQSKSFQGREYLQLYPYVKLAEINYQENLYVVESSNMYVSLADWQNRNSKPTYKSQNIDVL